MRRRLARKGFLRGVGVLALPLCTSVRYAGAAAEAYTMRLTLPTSAESILGLVGVQFSRSVALRSYGRVKIDVYPNGQLSAQQESIDNLVSGALDFALGSSSFLTQMIPRYQVFDMPFLFKDLDAGYRVLNSAIGSELFAELEPKGILGMCWGAGGMKQFQVATKAVAVPEDMKGLRFRIQSGAVFAATYQSLGAIPVTIDASEQYTALAQHTIDGVELNNNSFATNKLYTIVKHIAMSNHSFSVIPMLGSKRKIEALPPDLQKIVREEGKAVGTYYQSLVMRQSAVDIPFLKRNGVVFNEIQYPAFRKAVEPVYVGVQAKLGGNILERVARAANAA